MGTTFLLFEPNHVGTQCTYREYKMKYKAIFSDMDGTLLNSQHKISPRTEQAIKSVIRKGIPFIPVSARPPYAITPYTNQLQTNAPIICYSGALILDKELNELYSVLIDTADLNKLTTLLTPYAHLSISHYSGLNWFVNQHDYWAQQETEITGLQAQKTPENIQNVHKILIMGNADAILDVEQLLKRALPHLSIHRSKPEYLEIMNKSATKAKAIRFMEHYLHVSADEVIAFGDNFNDLDMLEYAGLSVAMGNAPEEIQQVAKEVTANNNEDGIALVLEREF